MAKIFLHYTCCLIVLTICVDQGDGVRKMRAKEIENVARQAEIAKNRHIGAEFMKRKERIDDIVREMDLLKGMAEMVDHHIDDFYEEFPRQKKKEHPLKTRHFSHKSSHDWLSTEPRPETAERRPKTTKRRSKSAKKLLRDRFRSHYNDTTYDKLKSELREQTDSHNDFWLHKKTKTKKATAESRNKYHARNHGRQYLHTLSDSEYDVENRKYSKATEMKIPAETTYNYNAMSKKYDDDDISLHKNIRSNTTPESPTKNHENKEKYEKDLSFHKNSKTTEIDSREFPSIYYKDSKKFEDDDYNFHKNIKTTDKTTDEVPHKHQNHEDDDYNFHKNTKTSRKITSELLNKHRAKNKEIVDDGLNFHKNVETSDKTTSETLNKYYESKEKYKYDDFYKNTRTTSASPNKYQTNGEKYEGDDFDSRKNIKTTEKTTAEFLNKHNAYSKQYKDDDFTFHKNAKTTNKSTLELHKYYAYKQKYDDDDLNKNTRTKSTSPSSKKYHANKQRYKDDDFDFQKSTKNTEKIKSEYPNKYYANSKKHKDDDFNFHKNIKTTDETTPEILIEYRANKRNRKEDDFNIYKNTKATDKTIFELPNKYHSNSKKIEDDDLNFHKNAKTTYKNTSESPNKYHAHKQKYDEHNDRDFQKNIKTAEKTTTESPNKYHTKIHNYDSKSFQKSSNSEDELDDIKYTTNTEMRTVPKNVHYSKKFERAEKHLPKLSEIEKDSGDYGTSTTETGTTTEFRKGYNLKKHENTKPHKLLDFASEKGFQPTESTQSKISIPLEKYYLKVDEIYKKYIQKSSNSNDDVIKSAKFIDATEIKTTAETQSFQTRPFAGRALDLEEENPTVHKHNDKVLHFMEPRSSSDNLRIELSQETDIGSTNTVPETLNNDNCEISTEISENDVEAHKLQTEDKLDTEDKLETKWTWPTFEHMLEEIGKKYDWRNDRWIELRRSANKKMTKADFINNFQEKHKFSYSTIKLNSTKSRRNVVIAVTAVR